MSEQPSDRLEPAARYDRDPQFRTLVDVLTDAIARCDYTPTEVREAAMLAAIRYETLYARPRYLMGAGEPLSLRRVDGYHGRGTPTTG